VLGLQRAARVGLRRDERAPDAARGQGRRRARAVTAVLVIDIDHAVAARSINRAARPRRRGFVPPAW